MSRSLGFMPDLPLVCTWSNSGAARQPLQSPPISHGGRPTGGLFVFWRCQTAARACRPAGHLL